MAPDIAEHPLESEVQRGGLGQQAGDPQNQGVNPDLPDASASVRVGASAGRRRVQEVIVGLEWLAFAFEKDVETQKGTGLLIFRPQTVWPGPRVPPLPPPASSQLLTREVEEESGIALCTFFTKGLCEKGKLCPLRHDRGGGREKRVACKKGDQCKFLHQYDVARMPEGHFFKSGDCNKERPFLHVKPAFKTQDCPWYDRGFCKHERLSP
ncbi:PREDICTED: LOW QUALITY PROTEIN: putative cleavage and polyadenylation specificity factor subunit 4-like protein [Capra hircus]|uniref:LOW QUALITY PROTEIN: putative cleavage and polyadenylation specificity factor subunit 4-like protein n=1 Tax=Capra hircus TaxID=9925 RepID=UPI0008478A7F|nr:PREDICTED: LOW QUALITY PROTEIN: putative cleavage and polyadenylation specificity factor subunit 4-like protein [Capra hircus]